jgi:hypothetical protein
MGPGLRGARRGLRSDGGRRRATAVAFATLLTACEVMVVDTVPLADLEVLPSQVTFLEGESRTLQARLTGPDGEVLGGRSIDWRVEDPGVALVTPHGVLSALAEGATTVLVEVEDLAVSVPVTVLRGPTLGLAPASFTVGAPSGQVQPIERLATVTNQGNGNLSALTAAVQRDDAPSVAWLQGTLDATSAPTTLRVRVLVTNLAPGTYRGRVRVSDPAARNVAQVVEVTAQVGEALPVIRLTPSSVQMAAAPGTQEPASQEVEVVNAGGGTLQGLTANVRPVEGSLGWLVPTFVGPSAPTTMILTASARFLPAGTYIADVDVTATSAPGIVGTVRVTFDVE